MAQIQTYPRKTTYDANDLILICDKTPDANGVVTNDTKTTTISTITDNLNVVDTVTASGSGITASPNKGNVVITNTGVTSLTAGTNISLSGSTGAITISTSASNVDGSGTAGTIPKWSDSNTLTDSIIKDQGGEDIIIPRFIKHDGDLNNAFGFSNASEFIVSVGPSTADQFLVSQNAIIMKTESGTKVATGPVGVTLYSDTSDTQTTTSVERFATTTTGAIVYGQTVAAGAASERGGIIRYYNNANDRYVGISGPVTQGTNYQIRLPDSVGTASQVLKLNNPILGGSTQNLVWSDTGGISGSGSTNFLPLYKNPTELTNSSISQDASADVTIGGAILNITPYVSSGLKIKDDGSQVTFFGPTETVSDYGLKLPSKPTAGGQALVLPSTLGSSPYQLEWSGVVTGHTVAPLLTSGSNITNNSTYDKQAILVQDVWTGGSYIPLSMSAFTPSTYDTSNPGKTGFAIYKGTIKESSSAIALSGSYLAERVAVGCHDIALTVNPGNDIKLFPGDFFVFVMFLEGDGSATANWAGASAVNDVDLCGLTAIEVAWPTSGAFPTLNSLITAGTVTAPRVCPAVTLQLS